MITVAIESFATTIDEALPLCMEHWEEVPFGKWPEIGLCVNTELYEIAEQLGNLLTIIARDDGKLVGYVLLMGCEMNHHKGMWHASTDVVYVHPEYRGKEKGVFAQMMKLAHEECKSKGVDFLSVAVNPNYDFSGSLEEIGAVCTEKCYTWRI